MQYRRFGRTGVRVSAIGYGGWGIGGSPWGRRNDRRSRVSLELALDLGINFFDTAYVYGNGHSESLIGEVIARRRARGGVYLATKIPPCGFRIDASRNTFAHAYPRRWIRSATERSLRKLKTDFIDLQQLHTWLPAWQGEPDWLAEIDALKKDGRIRWFGVSLRDGAPETALALVRSGLVDAVQVVYNIFDQTPARRLFAECQRQEVAVIVRSPLNEGALAGQFPAGRAFAAGDWRGSYFTGALLREIRRRTRKLADLLGKEADHLAELALGFCLAHEAVSTVIPGMRRAEHVQRNASVAAAPRLSTGMVRTLRRHAWS